MAKALVSIEKVKVDLGKRIKEIRELKGMTIPQLEAMDYKLHASDLSKYENGKKLPSVFTLHKLAHAFNMEVAEFFKKDKQALK